MVKTYRTIREWNEWLTLPLGLSVLAAERNFLTQALAERYGKHVVLIGVPNQYPLLKSSVMSNHVVLSPLINKQKKIKCIESSLYDLPIIPSSVDLVILPHTLEFVDNPLHLLTEACRAVKPEGAIIILGFNPMSLWGLKKMLVLSQRIPWSNQFIRSYKVKEWLKLADFEILKQENLLFRPPWANYSFYPHLKFMEWLGHLCHSPFGAVYVLTARPNALPLLPIKMHWKQKLPALTVTIPGRSIT